MNGGWTYRHRVRADEAGRTLVGHLAADHPHSDAQAWQARILAGEVTIDNAAATPQTVLCRGQWIAWQRPPWDEPDVPLDYGVLFEDAHLLAVAKPAGLPTMPAGGFLMHTLLSQVRLRHPGAHPVHRLGRFTSGVVLCARTAAAAAALGRQWHTAAVEKVYLARLADNPGWDDLEVTAPIGPVPHPRLGTVHAADAAGRRAVSSFRVLERHGSTTLCEVVIATGRPHQIRIHAAWAGHPLAGDPLYVAGGRPRALDPGLPGDGGYLLHACRLSVPHPVTGHRLDLIAPPPPALCPADARPDADGGRLPVGGSLSGGSAGCRTPRAGSVRPTGD